MADRRCFHRKIVESDQFYSLPATAQILYVHLCMAADDDGFLNCASSIAARNKTGKADLKQLEAKRFVLKFGEVYVIKHWRISNSLKNDRTKVPTYPSIAAAIWVKPNRGYTDHPVPGCRTLLELKTGIQSGIQNGIQLESKMESQQNRTELKGTELNRTEPNRSPEADFEQLWSGYPEIRRGSRETVFEAFRMTITSAEDADTALGNLDAWKKSEQWNKDGGQYIPYMSNWLERDIWKTVPAKKDNSTWGAGELGEAELEAIRQVLAQDDFGDCNG